MELVISIGFGLWIAVTAFIYRAFCSGGKGEKK